MSYPNVSPYVTSVGGTQLQSGWTWNPTQDKPFNDDGSRNPLYWAWTPGGSTQPVWNESWAAHRAPAAASRASTRRPAYQNPVAGVVGTHRGVPDLAWNAAVNGGVLSYHSFFPSIDGPRLGRVRRHVGVVPAGGRADRDRQPGPEGGRQGPIGDLNGIYSTSFNRARRSRRRRRRPTAPRPAACLKNNRIWDTGADGFVFPDAVPGYPTTTGYDLTTGWGSPRPRVRRPAGGSPVTEYFQLQAAIPPGSRASCVL